MMTVGIGEPWYRSAKVAAVPAQRYAVLRLLAQTLALALCVGAALSLTALGVFLAFSESHRVLLIALMSFLSFALFATLSALLLRDPTPVHDEGRTP